MKKNPSRPNRGQRKPARTNSDEFDLPAEPEVTRGGATSHPGREPDVRARRERAIKENAMRQQLRNRGSSFRRTGIAGGLSLIGGAGLGAALMYLLDPEAGRRRRAQLRDVAGQAASTTGQALGHALGHAWETAGDAMSPLAERAAEYGSAGAAAASSLGARIAERAGETAHSLREGARHPIKSARPTASRFFGHEHEEESHLPGAGATISAAACLAAGAGLMYLLDPADGARRRALLRDKTTRCLNETGDFFRKTGRHLRNRSFGIAHETRGMFRRDEASDQQLAERVRARIGHLQQRSTVQVAASDGRVTLTGRCAPGDVDALLATVQGTSGVASIVNLLEVRSESEPAGLGGTTGAPTAL